MANYIDGFVLPIPQKHLNQYRNVAQKVAKIWKEHGALAYFEYVGDDLKLEGTRSFPECLGAKENEAIYLTVPIGIIVVDDILINKKRLSRSRFYFISSL